MRILNEILPEYKFEEWLLKNKVNPEIVEHKLFKKDGIMSDVLFRAGIGSTTNGHTYKPIVEMNDDMIKITYPGDNRKYTFTFTVSDGHIIDSRCPLSGIKGTLQLSAIHEEKNKGIPSRNYRRLDFIEIAKEENKPLQIHQGSTCMDAEWLRFERTRSESSYTDDGIEYFREKVQAYDENLDCILNMPGAMAEALDPYRRIHSYAYKEFMREFMRTDTYHINHPSNFSNPYYFERLSRQQYNVALAYISHKVSRHFLSIGLNLSEKDDVEYSGYIPLDHTCLSDMRLLHVPGYSGDKRYFDAPEIPKMTEEEIAREISNTSATKEQKDALFEMAKSKNRTEFYYSYLEDPKYANNNGKSK